MSERHDVFVSYATADRAFADAAVHALEARGVRCWIAHRDIGAGATWSDAIMRAMADVRVMVLVVSRAIHESEYVLREVGAAVKKGVVIVPVRLEDYAPDGPYEFYLSELHWLDALDERREAAIAVLVDRVVSLVSDGAVAPTRPFASMPAPSDSSAASRPRRVPGVMLGVAGAVLATLALLAWMVLRTPGGGTTALEQQSARGDLPTEGGARGSTPDLAALIASRDEAIALRDEITRVGRAPEHAAEAQGLIRRLTTAGGLEAAGEVSAAAAEYAAVSRAARALIALARQTGSGAENAPGAEPPAVVTPVSAEAAAAAARAAYDAGRLLEATARYTEASAAAPDDQGLAGWALFTRGLCKASGLGERKDVSGGVQLIEAASESGLVAASRWLAQAYETGGVEGVPRDAGRSLRFWKAAADAGDGESAFQVALRYSQGRGAPADAAAAMSYAERAADAGSVDAMLLAAHLAATESVRMRWMERAAAAGSAEARAWLDALAGP